MRYMLEIFHSRELSAHTSFKMHGRAFTELTMDSIEQRLTTLESKMQTMIGLLERVAALNTRLAIVITALQAGGCLPGDGDE